MPVQRADTQETTGPYVGRMSAPRAAVAATAETMSGAFTVDELARAVERTRPGTGLATVYRAVTAMADTGWLECVGERNGTALYARCRAEHHHHHLVCTDCGRMVEVACPVGDHALAAAHAEGFTLTGHDIRLYGLCAPCSASADKDSRAAIGGDNDR